MDVIYLDFQEAFDKVPHKQLLHKLAAHGIRGELLLWIANWLSGRKQRVTLNGQCSSWKDVLSGVLQGSVLGQILSVIYINDIDVSVACKVLKFVDDTKIYRVVNSQEDIDSLRNDLKNLVKWSVDWQMLFNAGKCKIIHIGHNNCHADYYMGGNKLETIDEEKNLGVIVSKDLKWDKQCSQAVK